MKTKIKNIGWTLGNDCPCNCKHCYSMQVREKGKNLSEEIIDKVIEQVKKLEVETINLGGNEPIFTNGLKVQDSKLPYILKELEKANIKVGITTAGISLIALSKFYPECLNILNDVDISLDSPYPNEHNENRGGDVYKYAIEALEICKNNNIEAGIIMCAMNWNFTKDRIDGLLDLCKKYNANIRFNILKPIEKEHFKLMPTREQVLEMYKYLFEKCDTLELSEPSISGLVGNQNVQGCSCGIYSMRINSITPEGKIPVSPCVYMHDYKVGDILTDDIFDIVNSNEFLEFKTRKENYFKIEDCKDCDKGEICRGGCFAMAYTYKKCKTGEKDMFARDPFCYKENNFKDTIQYKKGKKSLVHENYLCTWIGKPKN